MIRPFAARIALLNASLAVVLFAIIGAIAAFVTYAVLQSSIEQSLDEAAREVPVIVGYYRLTTLASAAPRIVAQLERPGVRAIVHDASGRRVYDRDHPAGFEERDRGAWREGSSPAAPPDHVPPHGALRHGPPPPLGFEPGAGPPFGRGSGASLSAIALLAFLHVDPVRVSIRGGSVTLIPDATRLSHVWQMFAFSMALAGLLAALAAWGIGGAVSRQSLRPLREVTTELERFGDGDFTPRNVAALERGEFAGLARAYNRAASQVARALDERTAAEREMRQFIADAAHELRTPLTIVTGYVELLRGGVDRERSEKIFATIGAEGERMRELIAKLIALARLDATREARREPVDLSYLAATVADTFAGVDEAERLRVRIEPGVRVEGDAGELQEAVVNVIDNAMKYAGGAPVRVSLASDGEDAVLRVADDGPGMSEIEAANAFARFYRGDARGETEGSGLGLAIVARIVERAGGTIALATAPGEGAAFTIRLKRR